MFNFDHESPSLRHDKFALEEYTVTAKYGCVNIWMAKSFIFRIYGALAAFLPSHLLSKLLGMSKLAAFPKSKSLD
jgi:hypothetical protein